MVLLVVVLESVVAAPACGAQALSGGAFFKRLKRKKPLEPGASLFFSKTW